MGYMRHNAIIVTAWDWKYIKPAREEAVTIFSPPMEREKVWHVVSPIISSPINGYVSFFIAPDGSKLGWVDDELGDSRRDRFVLWMRNQRKTNALYLDWVEVQYGDDERETKIVRHSDDEEYDE